MEKILEETFARVTLSPADRGLCQELVYGVVRWQSALDWLIARRTKGRTQKFALRNLLRLGLYQIFWLERIPDHAAVHETVELAKRAGFGPQAGFINAILRGYLRELNATEQLLVELKTAQPHLGYSHPEWLVVRWQKRWGAARAAQLMDWNNTPPRIYARVNTLKLPLRRDEAHEPQGANKSQSPRSRTTQPEPDAGDLLKQWRDEDVEYDFVRRDWFPENLVFELKAHPPLGSLPSFQQGRFYVQDPSTLLAVSELNPQPGETVLDYCAAPGGKTTYIGQLMHNHGRLFAHDPSPERLKVLEENCARLGVSIADYRPVPDRGTSGPARAGADRKFDRILLDVPCSNTGVMRRRVDLRWRLQPQEITRLRTTQFGLLKRVAPLLRPGGTLVYSTCSLEPEENRQVIDEFLGEQPRFRLDHERELLPFADGVDGAFVARLSHSP